MVRKIEGLQPAAFAVAIRELHPHRIQNRVVCSQRLPHDERLRLFEHATNLLTAGNLADTGVASIVGEQNNIAREERSVRAAQVEQHAVISGHGNHAHAGD